ncbi:hypothetical protein [Nocardiopsis sp. MG754419]|uniref:hypothetical protein n=1 Tax=Nocardiopsis sp. MG754419 TaxID=2259865 RepID=UPI001BA74E5C|nr:hypothetical protein [Nocardiopsis sp. MG754419]MBR8743019.1 hypothetical protein [Nocardiopsis sp. MG754419]
MRLLIPGRGPFAPNDLVETFERAEVASTDRWPVNAAGVARRVARGACGQGLVAAPDDRAMAALRGVLGRHGTRVSFRGTDTLLIPLPGGATPVPTSPGSAPPWRDSTPSTRLTTRTGSPGT